MYTKYLTDRGQRQAFLETHRSTETRQRTQNENNRQEKLLLSGKDAKKIERFCILPNLAPILFTLFLFIFLLNYILYSSYVHTQHVLKEFILGS